MKVSGFTYMRNSFKYGYPVIESIKSVLPICDEFIAVVGKSDDGTREAIEAIGSEKIRIIDTVWDNELTLGGLVFAQQANIGLKECTGDWAFHIQSDEVIHERDLETLRYNMQQYVNDPKVEGFLFNFLHFIGDYKHIGKSRRWHRREIRIVKNMPNIFSYRDSQGFRKYNSEEEYIQGAKGMKLKVKLLNAQIFHYSYCRNPFLLLGKTEQFSQYYKGEKIIEKEIKFTEPYDFHTVIDVLSTFNETHPLTMQNVIIKQDWDFNHNPKRNVFNTRQKILHFIETLSGWRIGEYKNYKIV